MLQQKWSQSTKNPPLQNLLANMGLLISATNDQKCWKTKSSELVGLTPIWGSVANPCAPGWGFWICKVSKLGWWWDGPSSYKRCSNTLRALVSAHAGAVRPQNCPICLLSRLLCWSAIIGGTNPNHCCATNSAQFGHLDLYEIANHEHLSVADFPALPWGIHHGI